MMVFGLNNLCATALLDLCSAEMVSNGCVDQFSSLLHYYNATTYIDHVDVDMLMLISFRLCCFLNWF